MFIAIEDIGRCSGRTSVKRGRLHAPKAEDRSVGGGLQFARCNSFICTVFDPSGGSARSPHWLGAG